MTLVEALRRAKHNDVVKREYTAPGVPIAPTMWGRVRETPHGKFLVQGWGGSLPLDVLEADNWQRQCGWCSQDCESCYGDESRAAMQSEGS